jgi:acetyl esterase/lipase
MFPACYVEKAAEKLRSYGTACTVNNYENAEHGFFYDLTRNCQRMAFVDVLNFIEIISG